MPTAGPTSLSNVNSTTGPPKDPTADAIAAILMDLLEDPAKAPVPDIIPLATKTSTGNLTK